MTQVPEPNSIWVNRTARNIIAKVLFADEVSVYYRVLESDGTNNYSTRGERSTDNFLDYYEPKPRMTTHRVWVNLYQNGTMGAHCSTEAEALRLAKIRPPYGGGHIETRCIEWEVEE